MNSLFQTFPMEERMARRFLLVGTSRIVRQKADSASREKLDAYRMSRAYILCYLSCPPHLHLLIMIQGKIFVISQVSIGLKCHHSLLHYTYTTMNGSTSTAGTSTQVVIGSMERSEEYGAKLTELKSNGGNVQGEMVDRVLDKGKLVRPKTESD